MATVNPVADYPAPGVMRVTWDAIATGDTINWFTVPNAWGALAEVQMYTDSGGAWGSATVGMEATNASDGDGATALTNTLGSAVSATEDARFAVEVLSLKVRPTITGGTSDDINVVLMLRGGIVNT